MKVAIACDHGGLYLKSILTEYLNRSGVDFNVFGCFTSESVDYNDYAVKVCKAVTNCDADFGILICGTGIGMSIVANKIKGIRCAHCHDVFSAKMTRLHNDANVLENIVTSLYIITSFITGICINIHCIIVLRTLTFLYK